MHKYIIYTIVLVVLEMYHQYYEGIGNTEFKENFHTQMSKHLYICLFVLALFIYTTLESKNIQIVDATKHATIAIIIAFLAHSGLIVSTFTVIWLSSYYMKLDMNK